MKSKLLKKVTMVGLSFSLVFNGIPFSVLAAEITEPTTPTEISAENTSVEATEPVSESTSGSEVIEPTSEMATDSGVITAEPETLMEMRAPAAGGLSEVYLDTANGNPTKSGDSWRNAVKTMGGALSLVADGGTIYLKGVAYVAVTTKIDKDVTIVFSNEKAVLNVIENITLSVDDGKTLTIKSSTNPLPNGAIQVRNPSTLVGGNFVFDYTAMSTLDNQQASAAVQLLGNAKIDSANITITNTNLLAGGTSATSTIVNSVINHNSTGASFQKYNGSAPYKFENTIYNYTSNDASRIRFGQPVTMTNSTLNIDSQQGADFYAIVFGAATTMTKSTVDVKNYGSIHLDIEAINATNSTFKSDGIFTTRTPYVSNPPRVYRPSFSGTIENTAVFTFKEDPGIGRVTFTDSNGNNYEYGLPVKHPDQYSTYGGVSKAIPLPKVILTVKTEDGISLMEITLLKGTSLENLSGKVYADGVLIDKAVVEKLEQDIETEKGMDYSLFINGDISTPYLFTNVINENTTVVLKPSLKALDPKVKVSDIKNLTKAEKAEVEKAIRDANPGLPSDAKITVGDDGSVAVTTADDKPIGTLTGTDTVEQGYKAPSPKVKVVDASSLTEKEKQTVIEAVRAANTDPTIPTDATINVADDGTITITGSEGSVDTIAGADAVEKGLNNPEKVKVSDKNNLTVAEKAEVTEAVKKINPGLNDEYTITVADDGTVTVTKADETPIGTLTGTDTVEQGFKAPSPKVKVVDVSSLTVGEIDKIEQEFINANSEFDETTTEISIDAKTGTITITDKATGKTIDTIAGADAVEKGLNNPEKVKVVNIDSLTEAEKDSVKAAVKEANPGLNDEYTITVEDNGSVTVTKDGTQIGTIAKENTVEQGFKAPNHKVKVADTTKLVPEEKAKVIEAVRAANTDPTIPTDAKIEVADEGTISITGTDGIEYTIPGTLTVEEGINPPNPTVKVSDPAKLTDAEKAEVEKAIKEANPGLPSDVKITVGDDGTVTVTKVDETPIGEELKGADIVEQGVKSPSPKVPITDPQNLTDEEKEAVKEAIKNDPKLPGNAAIEVADDGTITIKDADGNIVDTIAGEDAVRKSDAATYNPQAPKTKVEVDNKDNLTTSEKELVKSAIKKANPNLPEGTTIEVGNDGTVTITYPDGTKDTIPGVETVEENDGAGLFDGVILPPQTTTQPVEPTTKTVQPLTTNSLLNTTEHKAYIFGYPDGTIKADNNMTRAEVSAMFARLLKNPTVQQPSNYTDVKEGEWYNEAIALMSQNKIVEGYENGEFRPNATITRAEFAAMVARFDQLVANNTTFTDVSATHWAYKYIASATGKGWMTGYPDGTFKPEQNITRAEVVTVTNRMLDRYADEKAVLNDNGVTKYTDLTPAHWAYYNMNEATNGKSSTRS